MLRSPKSISRAIDPKYVKRAQLVPDELVGPYLDSILMTLHQSLDGWRFHHVPLSQVEEAVDAFIALLTTAKSRGMS